MFCFLPLTCREIPHGAIKQENVAAGQGSSCTCKFWHTSSLLKVGNIGIGVMEMAEELYKVNKGMSDMQLC